MLYKAKFFFTLTNPISIGIGFTAVVPLVRRTYLLFLARVDATNASVSSNDCFVVSW
jgi:hypothetical protein